MLPTLAAGLYGVVILFVIGFQIALIAGAPWGHLTQGGQHQGALPRSGRIAAGVSILVLAAMGAAVSSAAGGAPGWPEWTGWVALAVQVLSTFMNWITPSQRERRLWAPITSAMLVLAAAVVLGAP